MAGDQIVNTVRSVTTLVPGRSVSSARNHHFVIDGTSEPAEELTPVEVFISSIAACGLHLLERFASETSVRLDRAEADITAVRPKDEPERFERIDLDFRLTGPSQQEAEGLVERFKGR